MKAKMILMTVAGLGLTGALMAGGPHGDFEGPDQGRGWHNDMHQQAGEGKRGDYQRRGMRRGFRRGVAGKTMRQLDLTRDQRKQLREMMKEQRKELRAKRRAYRDQNKKRNGVFKGLDVSKFMSVDNFDKEAFVKAQQDMFNKRKAANADRIKKNMQERADMMEKVFNILTPEQRVKLIQLSGK
jgi:Spy/CpxP family protein refolding chaperone